MEGFLTVRDCYKLLGCTRQYILAEIKRGNCPAVRKGNMFLIAEKRFRSLYAGRIAAEAERATQTSLFGDPKGPTR